MKQTITGTTHFKGNAYIILQEWKFWKYKPIDTLCRMCKTDNETIMPISSTLLGSTIKAMIANVFHSH